MYCNELSDSKNPATQSKLSELKEENPTHSSRTFEKGEHTLGRLKRPYPDKKTIKRDVKETVGR